MKSNPPHLDTICPKPDDASLEPTRRDLNRVLVEDPDWYSNFPAKPSDDRWKSAALEIILDDLIVKVCHLGHSPVYAWNTIREMIEADIMEAEIRQPIVEGYYNRDAGEGCVILKVTRERLRNHLDTHKNQDKHDGDEEWRAVSRAHDSLQNAASPAPEETGRRIPIWDEPTRLLSYNNITCRKYSRMADTQFRILAAFEEQGWPETIHDPLELDSSTKQTIYDINKKMIPNCPIRFQYIESSRLIRWSLS
jgi:hypothetical protein